MVGSKVDTADSKSIFSFNSAFSAINFANSTLSSTVSMDRDSTCCFNSEFWASSLNSSASSTRVLKDNESNFSFNSVFSTCSLRRSDLSLAATSDNWSTCCFNSMLSVNNCLRSFSLSPTVDSCLSLRFLSSFSAASRAIQMLFAFITVEIRTSSSFRASSRSDRRLFFSTFIDSTWVSSTSLSRFNLEISFSAASTATVKEDAAFNCWFNSMFSVCNFAISTLSAVSISISDSNFFLSSIPSEINRANSFSSRWKAFNDDSSFCWRSKFSCCSFAISALPEASTEFINCSCSFNIALSTCNFANSSLSVIEDFVSESNLSLNSAFATCNFRRSALSALVTANKLSIFSINSLFSSCNWIRSFSL